MAERGPGFSDAPSGGESAELPAPRPDLEGVELTREDVGALPVPRAVRLARGEKLPPPEKAPIEAKVAHPVPPRAREAHGPTPEREAEAKLRRSVPHAARTPEELGHALGRAGQEGVRDPQRGHEAGPPLPGDPGYRGDA